MALTMCDPTAQPMLEAASLAPRPESLRGRRLGLLQNGKHNAEDLVSRVFALLEPELAPAQIVRRTVPTTVPASEDFLDELATETDLVILAVGD